MLARGSVGDLSQHLGSTLNAIVVWACAAVALRYALTRDFKTHRRWALRLFLVASSSWFYRLTFFLWLLVFKGPFGFDPATFTGPFPTVMSFAQYLFPLAVLEIYLRAQDRPGALRRMATAGMLLCSLSRWRGEFLRSPWPYGCHKSKPGSTHVGLLSKCFRLPSHPAESTRP